MRVMTGLEVMTATSTTRELDTATNPAQVWAEVFTRWESSLRSPATRAAYLGDVARFTSWISEHTDRNPLEVRWADVDAWSTYMRETEQPRPAVTTQARRLAAVSSLYRFAVKAGALRANPADASLVDRPPTGPDYVRLTPALSEREVSRLLAAAGGPQDRVLVRLMHETGWRVSEALSLTWENMDTEQGEQVLSCVGKGGKINTAPVSQWLARELADLKAERDTATGPVFVAEHGGPMTRQGVARVLDRLAYRADLDRKVTPHVLRATFATQCDRQGVPVTRVQRAMRHSDPRTTMRYVRANDDLATHPAHLLAASLTADLADLRAERSA